MGLSIGSLAGRLNPVRAASNAAASIDDAVIQPVLSEAARVDDMVNEGIPGGWATVAVATGAAYGYYGGFETAGAESGMLEAGGLEGSTLGGDVLTAEQAASSVGAESLQTADVLTGAESTGGMAGVEAGSLPTPAPTAEQTWGAFEAKPTPSTWTEPFMETEGVQASMNSAAQTTEYLDSVSGVEGTFEGVQASSKDLSMLGKAKEYINYGKEQLYDKLGLTPTEAAYASEKATAIGKNLLGGPAGQQGQGQGQKKEIDPLVAAGLAAALTARRNQRRQFTRRYATGGVIKAAEGTLAVKDTSDATVNLTVQKDLTAPTLSSITTAAGTAPTMDAQQLATAAQTSTTDAALKATASTAPDTTAAVTAAQTDTPTDITAPTAVTADQITATKGQGTLETAQAKQTAATGTVSKDALVTAATQEPTSTVISDAQAAQGEATLVTAPEDRTLQAGELVSGSAVDMTEAEKAMAKNVAAQGTVTEEMTTQGQLNKMLADFDAGNPPAWAAGSMRAAMAQLAAKGLGASSLAGQAVIQAAMESAVPVAAADAKVFADMGLQNLSNRQQIAMLTAQQRATFLGQKFDQDFQTRVLNASKISDIANQNFNASVQIALENSRVVNNMNIANLNNRQAVEMAKIAQMATLETTNLNNRQQAAVENARSFLQMDLKNLDNQQQMNVLKSTQIANAILADTAAENAAKATNATNKLDADKINAQLKSSTDQFNAAEKNKIAIANTAAKNQIEIFNAQEKNDRAEFNANLKTQISMANAKVYADISTANTAQKNAVNIANANNATSLSTTEYAQLSQTYRDKMELAWKSSDNEIQRSTELVKTLITADATKYSSDSAADQAFANALGQLAVIAGSSGAASTFWTEAKKLLGIK